MVSALLEAGGDDSIRLKDDAGVTVLKLTKAKLKQDRATWDEIPKSEREGDFPDRFPSMLRFIQKPKKEKKPKKARVSRHTIAGGLGCVLPRLSTMIVDRCHLGCILLIRQRYGCGQVAADWEAEQAKRAEMQRLADELRGL